MNMRLLVTAAAAGTLALPALADIRESLLGDPKSVTQATRTITIAPTTRYVNVEGGQVVRFEVGGKTFTWNFDGAQIVTSFELNRVAPPGLLDHEVTAYVSPDPLYIASH